MPYFRIISAARTTLSTGQKIKEMGFVHTTRYSNGGILRGHSLTAPVFFYYIMTTATLLKVWFLVPSRNLCLRVCLLLSFMLTAVGHLYKDPSGPSWPSLSLFKQWIWQMFFESLWRIRKIKGTRCMPRILTWIIITITIATRRRKSTYKVCFLTG